MKSIWRWKHKNEKSLYFYEWWFKKGIGLHRRKFIYSKFDTSQIFQYVQGRRLKPLDFDLELRNYVLSIYGSSFKNVCHYLEDRLDTIHKFRNWRRKGLVVTSGFSVNHCVNVCMVKTFCRSGTAELMICWRRFSSNYHSRSMSETNKSYRWGWGWYCTRGRTLHSD